MPELREGARVRLAAPLENDPSPLRPGDEGVVTGVSHHEGWTAVDVNWDLGGRLSLIVPPDRYEVVS